MLDVVEEVEAEVLWLLGFWEGLLGLVVWLGLGWKEVEVAATVKSGKGHSQHRPRMPRRRFIIWRIGMGRTQASRLVVRKSQNSFGQKKPWIAAAI